jgi:uncharacterized FAD-dependent dehydrogenase
MKYRINQIKTDIDTPMSELPRIAAGRLGLELSDIEDYEVRRKSIDSRKKPDIFFVYTLDITTKKKILTKTI